MQLKNSAMYNNRSWFLAYPFVGQLEFGSYPAFFWSCGLGPGLLIVFLSFLGPAVASASSSQEKRRNAKGQVQLWKYISNLCWHCICSHLIENASHIAKPKFKRQRRSFCLSWSHGKIWVNTTTYHRGVKTWDRYWVYHRDM